MNDSEKIVIGITTVWIGLSVRSIVKSMRRERARRREIAVRLDRDLLALSDAQMQIEKRICNGEFNRSTVGAMIEEFDRTFNQAKSKY